MDKSPMENPLGSYFRCPNDFVNLGLAGELRGSAGFFRFGPSVTCFGRSTRASQVPHCTDVLTDVLPEVRREGDQILLPFDVSEVVSNLRMERYCAESASQNGDSRNGHIANSIYYFFRPLLGVSVRKYLQRFRLRHWDKIPFPHWPVDSSVDTLYQQVLRTVLRETGVSEIPFIWFWPDGASSAVIMTHDVEGPAGLKFSEQLMSIDESFGIRSAFQVVPEERYAHDPNIVERFWKRGFEVNVHDLNHDGALFGEKEEFTRRAAHINEYARQFGTRGFRAGAMYRRQEWYDAFDLSYDMSVPNVAHLEPQRGGCCTVMPYFIGNILELPLTTTQDYSLFHIVGDYSIDLWKRQIDFVRQQNGLISFIVHPDYITEEREQRVYRDLLAHLAETRKSARLWITLPGEVDRWWRNRAQMSLVREGTWRITGPDSERARVAFASLEGDRLVYRMDRCGADEMVSQITVDQVTPSSSPTNSRRDEPVPLRVGSGGEPSAETNFVKRAKIWIDLDNSPHVPFFLPIIAELRRRGFPVLLTARDSYQVCELLRFHHVSDCQVVGRHHGKNRLLKMAGTCLRAGMLLPLAYREKPDLAVSHGSRGQLLASAVAGIPVVTLADYEFTSSAGFARPDWLIVPEVVPDETVKDARRGVLKYPGLKEDVYVPSLHPDPSVRTELGIDESDIVVTVRPPATEAHYHNPDAEVLLKAVLNRLTQTPLVRVILLPRNKRQESELRGQWADCIEQRKIIIPPQVIDGLNLIWFSDLVISGGGTMNREAAALGVPVYSIFRCKIGGVDRYLSNTGRLVLLEQVQDVQTKIVIKRRHASADNLHNTPTPAFVAILDNIVSIAESVSQPR
jgi:predicted glycosyltransferase